MGEKIKVALIDPVGGHGGMDYYDYGLAQGLCDCGVEVHYFTCNNTRLRFKDYITTHFPFGNIWHKRKLHKISILFTGYLKSFLFAKKHNIRTVHFQFFHLGLQNVITLYFAYLFSLKRIVTLHDINSFKRKEIKLIQNIGLRLCSKIIVHNQFSYDELVNKGINKNKVHIIAHGNYIPFVKSIAYNPTKKDQLRLLFFGQIKEVKGLELLLRAMEKLKSYDIHLTIAGRPWGVNESYYIDLIKSLKLQNQVTTNFNYIPNNEVENFFKECDIVVLPYRKIYQSGVLLLAMSYGRVTLCSNLKPFREIVEDENTGYLFKSENIDSLAKKIESIALNKDKIKNIRQNALDLLKEKFDWKLIANKTSKLYK